MITASLMKHLGLATLRLPIRVVNIGGGRPVGLLDFVSSIERWLQRVAVRRYLDMQPGDVSA